MEKFGLLTQKEVSACCPRSPRPCPLNAPTALIAYCVRSQGYWDGYDSNVNPNVIDAFAAAAFRFGHSLLPTAIERWSKAHKFIGKLGVHD